MLVGGYVGFVERSAEVGENLVGVGIRELGTTRGC